MISTIPTLQVVQEYERAVIFRLGRLLSGGSRGPGLYIGQDSDDYADFGNICEVKGRNVKGFLKIKSQKTKIPGPLKQLQFVKL